MQVVYISKEQILFQESKIAKVIWIFDVVSHRLTRFLLSEFVCAKLKTKFGGEFYHLYQSNFCL
jgi:hypothetical protein